MQAKANYYSQGSLSQRSWLGPLSCCNPPPASRRGQGAVGLQGREGMGEGERSDGQIALCCRVRLPRPAPPRPAPPSPIAGYGCCAAIVAKEEWRGEGVCRLPSAVAAQPAPASAGGENCLIHCTQRLSESLRLQQILIPKSPDQADHQTGA